MHPTDIIAKNATLLEDTVLVWNTCRARVEELEHDPTWSCRNIDGSSCQALGLGNNGAARVRRGYPGQAGARRYPVGCVWTRLLTGRRRWRRSRGSAPGGSGQRPALLCFAAHTREVGSRRTVGLLEAWCVGLALPPALICFAAQARKRGRGRRVGRGGAAFGRVGLYDGACRSTAIALVPCVPTVTVRWWRGGCSGCAG